MKVVIPGGSGQVGTVLARALHRDGHDVVVLSRRRDSQPWRVVAWDGTTLGNWRREIDGCDVLVLVRFGLGGSAGDGRQFMSWIHYEDFIAAIRWLIDRDDIDGTVNVAAPNPLPNAEFMRRLREAWGVPFGLPANKWMLEIGAAFMRTETELVLKSRRVVPARLLEHGFRFKYPDWREAARDLCRQYSGARDQVHAA